MWSFREATGELTLVRYIYFSNNENYLEEEYFRASKIAEIFVHVLLDFVVPAFEESDGEFDELLE